jgi:WD40 repeat protein
VTPDGHRAVSASNDRTLRLWDLESGKAIATYTGDGRINSCALTPDWRTIIAGDALGRMHFLRLVDADETKPAISDAKIVLLHHKEQGTSATDS